MENYKKILILIMAFVIIGSVSAISWNQPSVNEFVSDVWQRIGNVISPKNVGDNLDMSGGNVTADYFIGNGSQLTGVGDTTILNQTNIISTNVSIRYGVNESSGELIAQSLSTEGYQVWAVN